MHPSEGLLSAKSTALTGKKIVLGITGSIAAIESFELARELIRHGAEVHAVMTTESLKIMTPQTMHFATGNEVITDLDGGAQHVTLLGDYKDRADLLLISPCTANTISKIACGIDDTTVTTMATVAIGSHVPMVVAPAMHLAMYEHPVVQKNVAVLRELGVQIIGPNMEGKKARIASVDEITEAVIRAVTKNDLAGKTVLVIGGSSEEPIDQVRVITNNSSGETAVQLARAAHERGADVELWAGRMQIPVPSFLRTKRFRTVEDALTLAREASFDIAIVPAALSDFAPDAVSGKISSDASSIDLRLHALPKVLPVLKQRGGIVIGFKAEVDASDEKLIARSRERLIEHGIDIIVANDLRNVSGTRTKAVIIPKDGEIIKHDGSKRELAHRILDAAVKVIR